MYEEIVYRMALPLQTNYSNGKVKLLLEHYGSAKAVFEQYGKQKKTSQRKANLIAPLTITKEMLQIIDKERNRMEKEGIGFCFISDENFPKRLKHCQDASYYFFYKGSDDFHFPKSIAIVGTRKSTSYGKDCVKRILSDFALTDVVIVSGLAVGIDTAAHQYALEFGLRTVGVMGTGFQQIYPKSNTELVEEMLTMNGSVLSEFFYYSKSDRRNFPIRNKVIAGLADATIVVETAVKGGSMITAHLANSYHRDVFAVPGNIFNKTHDGCHELIRNNWAALITSGTDLLEMMNWNFGAKPPVQRQLFRELDADEEPIVTFIEEKKEASIDEIIGYFNRYTVSKVTSFLLNLEFKGVLECKPGKIYRVLE